MSYKKIIIIALIFLPAIALADRIDQLLELYPRVSVSILVKDLKTGQNLYSRNPKQLMVPASVTKVFTAYAALDYLGAGFTYNTKILENNDDLYIKFSGDPSLTKEDLKQLLAKISKHKNITKVMIDDSIFDQEYLGNGWAWDDSKFCFSAPVSAAIVDGNCFKAKLEPNGSLKYTKIFAKIDNKLLSKADTSCSSHLHANPDNSYDLSGCVNSDGQDILLNIAYQDPRLMIKEVIKDELLKRNKELKPTILFKQAPVKYQIIAEHKSSPLAELIKKMLKESDNVYADSILKTIGAKYYGVQGSFADGVKAVKAIVKLDEVRIVDGSGASRYNLIASDQLVDLFIKVTNNSKVKASFYDALPISAIDGSLEKRFIEHPQLHGKIYAKTGSMKGVSALVGYLDQDKVFAIIINGFTCSLNEIRKLEEEIIKATLLN